MHEPCLKSHCSIENGILHLTQATRESTQVMQRIRTRKSRIWCQLHLREYRAIGQTLYEKYPTIGTAGPKPWSFLCRSLSQRIRAERWQRRKVLIAQKRKEYEMKKIN